MVKKKNKKNIIIIILVIITISIGFILFLFVPNIFIINVEKLNGANLTKIDKNLISSINQESVIPFTKQSVISTDDIKYKVIIKTINNQNFINSNKINISSEFDKQNIVIGSYSISEIINISNNNQVIKIYNNQMFKISLGQSVDIIRAEPSGTIVNDNGINIGSANTNTFGKGVKVCIIDTGIDDTNPYIGSIPTDNKMSFVDSTSSTYDDNSHGTHVAGIIMSSSKRTSTKLTTLFEDGMAPDTTLYIAKVCDSKGNCPGINIINAIDWCINKENVDIISMSLGSENTSAICDDDIFCQYINSFSDNKAIFVAASGNTGTRSFNEPSCCSNVVSVGSIKKDRVTVSSFSSTGKVDILAVGQDVVSTIPGNNVASYSGTSMATPMISGALSILKSIKPTASKTELLNALYSSATNLKYSKDIEGNGLANVHDACIKLLDKTQCNNLFKGDYGSSMCGNNLIEGNEQCDGTAIITKSCTDLGKSPGTLGCTSYCQYDFSKCGNGCGNNLRENFEQCDGTDMGSLNTANMPSGTSVSCTSYCQYNITYKNANTLAGIPFFYNKGLDLFTNAVYFSNGKNIPTTTSYQQIYLADTCGGKLTQYINKDSWSEWSNKIDTDCPNKILIGDNFPESSGHSNINKGIGYYSLYRCPTNKKIMIHDGMNGYWILSPTGSPMTTAQVLAQEQIFTPTDTSSNIIHTETSVPFVLNCGGDLPNCYGNTIADFNNGDSLLYKGVSYTDTCKSSSASTFKTNGDQLIKYTCKLDNIQTTTYNCGPGVSCTDGKCNSCLNNACTKTINCKSNKDCININYKATTYTNCKYNMTAGTVCNSADGNFYFNTYGSSVCINPGAVSSHCAKNVICELQLDCSKKGLKCYMEDVGGGGHIVKCIPKSCTPQCSGKSCGNDGCSGSCGTCNSGYTCNSIGQCITGNLQYQCPSLGKQCGNWNDGCGNSVNCGTCSSGQNCNNGACI